MRHTFSLAALKAKNLPHCTFGSLGVKLECADPNADPKEVEAGIAEARADIDRQFHPFIPWQKDCIGCGSLLVGSDIAEAFLRCATFTYGLAHGEGFCSACGYPSRRNHHPPKDEGGLTMIKTLQYHPDELQEPAPPRPRSTADEFNAAHGIETDDPEGGAA